jgi:branched-chain amino acid aminotransferase
MAIKINFNGCIEETASVSAFDHGFLFGDSVYEVVATHQNHPCFLNEHLARLRQSANAIALQIPWTDDQFKTEINRTVQEARNSESYIRIIVTRGEGEIDIDPSSCRKPNILLYVTPLKSYPEEYYRDGVDISLVSIKRNSKDALNPGIKTGNYLNNVLAQMEAIKGGAKDALMLNHDGHLTECTTSNFFMVRNGALLTPSLDCGILSGITREVILELANENGILVEEGKWLPEELDRVEEAFISGSIKKIMPVCRIDNRLIGEGKVGAVTKKLIKLYGSVLENIGATLFQN